MEGRASEGRLLKGEGRWIDSLSLSPSLSLLPSPPSLLLPHLLRQVGLLQVEPRGLVAEHADLVVEQAGAAGDVVGAHGRKLGREAVVDGLACVLGVVASAEDLGLHVRCGHGVCFLFSGRTDLDANG